MSLSYLSLHSVMACGKGSTWSKGNAACRYSAAAGGIREGCRVSGRCDEDDDDIRLGRLECDSAKLLKEFLSLSRIAQFWLFYKALPNMFETVLQGVPSARGPGLG